MKKGMATGILAALMISALPALAADGDTQEFTYAVGQDSVYLSGDVQTSENADVFWGIYDNGVLIKLDKHSSRENFENVKVSLPYMPENLEIKSFVWTADNNMSPLTVREDPSKAGNVVTIKTDLIPDTDSTRQMYTLKNIPVQISEDSTNLINYKLDESVKLFINNVRSYEMDDSMLINYILNNSYPTVDIIDTDNDGDYDYISASYYVNAVIDYTEKTSSYNRIGFKTCDCNNYRLQYDPEDSYININITKDGQSITFDDLKEYDVLNIAYDVTGAFEESAFYDIIVSNDVVEGKITTIDPENSSLFMGDAEYKVNPAMVYLDDLEAAASYKLYMNSFGQIVYYEENDSDRNIGILVAMYTSSGNDYPTVRFIDFYGNIVSYECKDSNEADMFYSLATGTDTEYNGESVGLCDVADNIENMVFEYSLSSDNKIKFKSALTGRGGDDLVYRQESNRLGSYSLTPDVTKIFYIGDYIHEDGKIYNLKTTDLIDSNAYSAYLYDRSTNADYRFCIILNGITDISVNTSVAVVQSKPVHTVIDNSDYVSLDILKDGLKTTINVEPNSGAESVSIGDIIIYGQKPDGVISSFYKVMSAEQDYTTMFNNYIPYFSDIIETISDNNDWTWSTDSKPSKAYFGPVYMKSGDVLELFISETNGKSSVIDDTEIFNTANADTYIYDYNKTESYRVSSSPLPDATSGIYRTDDDLCVDWSNGYSPQFAYVRTVNDEAVEVVLFNAPTSGNSYSGNNSSVEINIHDIPKSNNASYGMFFNKMIPAYDYNEEDIYNGIIKYHLADDFELYVNDIPVDASDSAMVEYILDSTSGIVKLENKDDDIFFDKVYVYNYLTGVVDRIEGNEIFFKTCSGNMRSVAINESADLEIIKGDTVIGLNDISEYDAVNIIYDVTNDVSESSFFKIIVYDNTVKCNSNDIEYLAYSYSVRINDTVYRYNPETISFSSLELDTEYTLILDSLNEIIGVEGMDDVYITSPNLGILSGIKPSENSEFAQISFITPDGETIVMNASSHEDENKFYSMAVGSETEYANEEITKADISNNIQNMVFTYSIEKEKIIFNETCMPQGGKDLEYNSSVGRLGLYRVNDKYTYMLDLTEDTAISIGSSALCDGNIYTAYVYNRNSSGVYELCIFTEPIAYIAPETSVAVVMSAPQSVEDNLISMVVAKDNSENIAIYVEEGLGAEAVKEGDIVIYSTSYDGIVKDFHVVLEGESDYSNLFNKGLNGFSSNILTSSSGYWNWSTSSCPVKAYFGPVYQKSNNTLEIFTGSTDNQSNIFNDTEMFDIMGANTYIYDYSSSNQYRVTSGSIPNISRNIYNTILTGWEKEIVDWSTADINDVNPSFAFVKETNGNVTDVVLYLAQ